MVENDDTVNHVEPTTAALMDSWVRALRQATEKNPVLPVDSAGGVDPLAWRRHWFEAMSQATEAYLRSPLFLDMLKGYLDSLVDAKRRTNLQKRSPRSGGQLAQDVRAMHQRLKQLRRRLDGLEGIPHKSTETKRAYPSILPEKSQYSLTRVTEDAPEDVREDEYSQEFWAGVTPSEVVYEEDKLKLRRYVHDGILFAEPILICFALVNRPYILDLKEGRSVVRQLMDRGFDVYLIDWGVPSEEDSRLELDDYVCSLLRNAVRYVCDLSSATKVNLLGYCMGGTMATMYTALHQESVRNLILMAAPIDFSGDEGLLYLWSRADYFDVDQLIDAYGNCPGEFLQFCFQLMKPVQNFAEKQLALCENLEDAAYVENFVALERWANDSIPVAGETFRQYVKALFQQNRLVKGPMLLAGRPVRLEAITCPLLLLVAEKDHLVPPNSTLALKMYTSSVDVRSMSIGAGHVGLAVSSKAHRQLWPQVANWIADHSTHL